MKLRTGADSVETGEDRLPLEVWEYIIDILARNTRKEWNIRNSRWWQALYSCALTCRTLYSRARWHLRGNICLMSQHDVASLSKALRREPYLRQTMRFITVTTRDPSTPVSHLGTFAVMSAGLMPNAEALEICNTTWRVGSTRPDDIACLSAFRSLRELELTSVHFATVSRFTRLVEGLPRLQALWCNDLSCNQSRPQTAPPPVRRVRLRTLCLWGRLDPIFYDVLFDIVERSDELVSLSGGWHFDTYTKLRLRRLLDTCSQTLEDLHLTLNLDDADDRSPETLSRELDISAHQNLSVVQLSAWCDAYGNDYSWISHLLSSVGSTGLETVRINFHIGTRGRDVRLEKLFDLLYEIAEDTGCRNPLIELDECLSSPKFIKVEKLVIGIAFSAGGIGHETLGVTEEQWHDLVKQRMPLADKRGILSTTVYQVW